MCCHGRMLDSGMMRRVPSQAYQRLLTQCTCPVDSVPSLNERERSTQEASYGDVSQWISALSAPLHRATEPSVH